MKKKSKKGFTLVELIVVVALLAIIGVAVISIMTPAGNMFAKMQKQAQAKMIASEVMQVIEPQVRFGTNLTLSNNSGIIGSDSSKRYLYISGGMVKVRNGSTAETDLFGSDFYNGYSVSMMCSPAANTVTITITVIYTSDNSITSTLTTAVQNMNTDSIAGSNNSTILYYQWLTAPAAT